MTVTYALGAEMLVLAEVAPDVDAARRMMEIAIGTGRAAEHFQKIIEAAGGQPGGRRRSGAAAAGGGGASCSPRRGAASSRASSPAPSVEGSPRSAAAARRWRTQLDLSVGFVITARPGDWVEQGEPLATIFARDRAGVEAGRTALRAAITIADEADPPLPLVSHRVTSAGVELLVGD